MMTRAKAPTVRATGCPVCEKLSIPGTACAECVEAAHGAAVRAAEDAVREAWRRVGGDSVIAAVAGQQAQDARAAWVGACLLLDELGVLLVAVGFEVPARGVPPEGAVYQSEQPEVRGAAK